MERAIASCGGEALLFKRVIPFFAPNSFHESGGLPWKKKKKALTNS
jgi:hypothetical protein